MTLTLLIQGPLPFPGPISKKTNDSDPIDFLTPLIRNGLGDGKINDSDPIDLIFTYINNASNQSFLINIKSYKYKQDTKK